MLGHTKRESNMRVNRFVLDNNIWVSYLKANLERKFKKLKILTKAEFEEMFSK